MRVLTAIQLMLVAQLALGSDARVRTLSCEPRPPSPASITGRIVSRDGTAQPSIQVRAIVRETGREYRTVSDGEGRYELTGFNAEVEVQLEFGDTAKRLGTGCTLVPTRTAPALRVDVVLDQLRAGEMNPQVGCSQSDWRGSWVSQGDFRFLSREEAEKAFPREPDASKPEPSASLNLRATEIAKVTATEDGAALRLTPGATEALRLFTEANVGRMSAITIEGEFAGRAVVQGTISSGAMHVSDRYLRGQRLCEILEAISRRQQSD